MLIFSEFTFFYFKVSFYKAIQVFNFHNKNLTTSTFNIFTSSDILSIYKITCTPKVNLFWQTNIFHSFPPVFGSSKLFMTLNNNIYFKSLSYETKHCCLFAVLALFVTLYFIKFYILFFQKIFYKHCYAVVLSPTF